MAAVTLFYRVYIQRAVRDINSPVLLLALSVSMAAVATVAGPQHTTLTVVTSPQTHHARPTDRNTNAGPMSAAVRKLLIEQQVARQQ